MKTKASLSSLLYLWSFWAIAQCNPYFDIPEGASRETATYNSKGKLQTSQISTVKSISRTGSGWTGVMHVLLSDDKGKEIINKDFEAECANGIMKMDMSRFMPAELAGGSEVTVTSDNLEWPAELSSSSVLPDASLTVTASILKIVVDIKDRKVIGESSVTTKAGTYDCIKVQYTTHIKSIASREVTQIDYVAKNVGVVKTETLDKKGKVSDYTELVKVTGL